MSAQSLPIGASGMGIDVTKITLLSWKPLYLAGKVWFNIIKYEYVKEFHFCVIFLAEKFVLSMITRIFAPPVPTKPLNDAQMRGAFLFLWVYGNKNSVYKNIFHAPWVSATTQNKRYGVLNLGLKSLLFVSNQAHTDLTDSNYFQTLQLLFLQHLLPASFRQQEGGALMVLIQSKKMKSVFSYLILGFLQGADS